MPNPTDNDSENDQTPLKKTTEDKEELSFEHAPVGQVLLFKIYFWAFCAFITQTGQLKSRQETGEREGEWHAAKGQRWNRTHVCCGEDKFLCI